MGHPAKLLKRDDQTWEQVVMAEMLIPNVPNSYGDVYTEEAIREAAYLFAQKGYATDTDHDQEDILGTGAVVVESFIAREGDPDFIKGSWVVAMKILDDELWAKILGGEINGYSYEATALMTPIVIQNLANRQVVGVTEPDPIDGHTHDYVVLLNALNRPVSGGTGVANGHSHRITTHTVTSVYRDILGNEHNHRYQVIQVAQAANEGV